MKKQYSLTVLGKKVDYAIRPKEEDGDIFFELSCPLVNFIQLFDAEDLSLFLTSEDFEFFIADHLRKKQSVKSRRLQVRVTEKEQMFLEKKAIKTGFRNISDYVRDKVLA